MSDTRRAPAITPGPTAPATPTTRTSAFQVVSIAAFVVTVGLLVTAAVQHNHTTGRGGDAAFAGAFIAALIALAFALAHDLRAKANR